MKTKTQRRDIIRRLARELKDDALFFEGRDRKGFISAMLKNNRTACELNVKTSEILNCLTGGARKFAAISLACFSLASCGIMRTEGMKPSLVDCGQCEAGTVCETYRNYDPHYFTGDTQTETACEVE